MLMSFRKDEKQHLIDELQHYLGTSYGAGTTSISRRRPEFLVLSTIESEATVSFQAYLDNIEAKTGRTPNDFIALAKEKGFDDPDTKAGAIVAWLEEDFGLGHGHAMALVHVIKNGPIIGDNHVGSDGSHRDQSDTLRLDGKDER